MKYNIDFIIQNNDDCIKKSNINAFYKKNKELKFNYDNESIKISINKDNIVMEKENNDSLIIFNFILNKNTETKYYIKSLDSYIDTKIKTNKLIINEDKIYIEYELWLSFEYSGLFKYQIDIKEK